MRFVDAFLGFAFGQDLHHGLAAVMRPEHDSHRIGRQQHKDIVQHMHHEVHRRDVIVVDDDTVQRLVGCLLLLVFADLDVWCRLCFHFRSAGRAARFRCLSIRCRLRHNSR